MKYLLCILGFIALFSTSCSTECEKILTGHVYDNVTGDDLSWFELTVEGAIPTTWGADFPQFDVLTDEVGEFEIVTKEPITEWRKVKFEQEDYVIRDVEYASDKRQVCGDNHVEIALHKLAELEVEIYEDVDVWATSLKVYTEFNTHVSKEEFKANESVIVPVLEEVPNDIYILYFNKYQETVVRDTISVTVASGETQKLNVGL